MKVLITGGTGFIGSRLALACLGRGLSVTVLGQVNTDAETENKAALEERGVEVVLVSVTDDLRSCLDLSAVDVVFHLAAAQHEMNIPDQVFWAVNVQGTRKLLEISAEAKITRFVHGSTIGVYGVPSAVLDENSECKPDNIYGRTKLEGERVALSFGDRLPVVVVRIPEVYGPGDRRLLKMFRLVGKGSFPVLGSGRNLHHLIYVDDLVDGLLLAADHPDAVGEIFLLAGERPVTTDEMVSSIASALGRNPLRYHLPLFPFLALGTLMELTLRPLGIQPPLHRRRIDFFRKSFELSWAHARNKLGFEPKISFDEGARRTARHYRDNGMLQ